MSVITIVCHFKQVKMVAFALGHSGPNVVQDILNVGAQFSALQSANTPIHLKEICTWGRLHSLCMHSKKCLNRAIVKARRDSSPSQTF